ncbi:Isochorismatase hydrolase [Microthyrium microscopicum]|uniref:Isochorismatase hydrolase n=1 Tax=Microthyrium microscopicum TaxID=703497 RepID=A0A6A6UUE2_9PEZI|nr:Isochorismatase hydrolase [Microthyrium microscopicum]
MLPSRIIPRLVPRLVPRLSGYSKQLQSMATVSRKFDSPALFICDIQENFRPAISTFPHIIATTQKLLTFARLLKIPVIATTQLRAKLGPTCAELNLPESPSKRPSDLLLAVHADKTRFSMYTEEVQAATFEYGKMQVALVGIEAHICVSQTALDLQRAGHAVSVIADGVGSVNGGEVRVALDRLRAAGVTVTTSESWMYECMGDAEIKQFREVSKLVKESKEATRKAVEALCGS